MKMCCGALAARGESAYDSRSIYMKFKAIFHSNAAH